MFYCILDVQLHRIIIQNLVFKLHGFKDLNRINRQIIKELWVRI